MAAYSPRVLVYVLLVLFYVTAMIVIIRKCLDFDTYSPIFPIVFTIFTMFDMPESPFPELWEGVSFSTRLGYAVGHVLNDICSAMWFTYLLVYFHLVLEFNPTQAGLVLLIGQVADGIATPFVGYYSDQNDNFWLCKYGRRKTWHLIGTICTVLAFPFIFGTCVQCESSDRWAQLIYYSAFVVIFQFGWAAVQISHLSLIPELTPSEHERTQLTALRYSFTVVSTILVYSITFWSLGIESESRVGPDDGPRFRRVMWIGISIGLVASIVFHVVVRETNGLTRDDKDLNQPELRTIKNVLSDKNLYTIGCVYMASRIFINLTQVVLPLYLHETLKLSAKLLAIIPLCVYLCSFLASFLVQPLNKYRGRKFSYFIGVLIAIIACVWMRFRDGVTYIRYEIYCVSVLLGIAISILLITSLGLTADYIGPDTHHGAFVYGLMSFSDKVSNGLVVIVIQHLHTTTFKSDTYYRDIMIYVCGTAAIFGFLAILVVRISRLRRGDLYLNPNEHENLVTNFDVASDIN